MTNIPKTLKISFAIERYSPNSQFLSENPCCQFLRKKDTRWADTFCNLVEMLADRYQSFVSKVCKVMCTVIEYYVNENLDMIHD